MDLFQRGILETDQHLVPAGGHFEADRKLRILIAGYRRHPSQRFSSRLTNGVNRARL